LQLHAKLERNRPYENLIGSHRLYLFLTPNQCGISYKSYHRHLRPNNIYSHAKFGRCTACTPKHSRVIAEKPTNFQPS